MANQQCPHNESPAFQATEALAFKQTTEGILRPRLGFVDLNSLRLFVDNSPPDQFPRIEWSTYSHDDHEVTKRSEILRRSLERQLKRANLGLVRSKSMLCLPSATRDYLVRHERATRRGSSRLSAIARKQVKTQTVALPPSQLSCLLRSHEDSLVSSLRLSKKECSHCVKTNHEYIKTYPLLDTPHAARRSNEQRLLQALLHDCPFPSCP